MLKIVIPQMELFDESNNKFINIPQTTLQLEHSLISIKKWEAKWHIPFLKKDNRTEEQIRDYIHCMCINQVDRNIINYIPKDIFQQIIDYIADPMTATTVTKRKKEGESGNPKEILTAELIYYYMIKLEIPIEFQKWHFNQLMTLIQVFEAKDGKENKKMSAREASIRRNALNAKRKARLHSKG